MMKTIKEADHMMLSDAKAQAKAKGKRQKAKGNGCKSG